MYTKSIAQKVCIITGSSSGLGRASALWFGRANYRLVIHGAVGHEQDLLATHTELVEAGLPESHITEVVGTFKGAGTGESHTAKRIVEAALKAFGRIDVLVNNAGQLQKSGPEPVSAENLDDIIVHSVAEMSYLCMPELAKNNGCIVNISSCVPTCTLTLAPYYSVTKSAVDHLTRNFAMFYAEHRVRVNCVKPGPVKTPIYRQLGIVNDAAAAQLEALVLEMTAQTRFAGPEEILAYAIVFLASKAASAITGCCIEADCGWQVYGGPRGENK